MFSAGASAASSLDSCLSVPATVSSVELRRLALSSISARCWAAELLLRCLPILSIEVLWSMPSFTT